MKTYLLKNKVFFIVLFAVGLLSFAGARYEIYRLSPAPKNAQIIGEVNGKWAATSAGSLFNEFYDASDNSYAYWGTAYNANTDSYEWTAVFWPNPLTQQINTMGSIQTDSKGQMIQSSNATTSAPGYFVNAFVYNDTTGITVDVCCVNDSTYRLVFSRADTLLKNFTSATAGFSAWTIQQSEYPPAVQ